MNIWIHITYLLLLYVVNMYIITIVSIINDRPIINAGNINSKQSTG
jgi:hypothetical protein